MLTLIVGDVGSGKTSVCLEEIADAVRNRIPCKMIVPEQETVTTESVAADRLPARAALFFEVTNFTRLANTVFRRSGGLARPYATPDTKALLMYKTIRTLAPYLKNAPERFDAGHVRKYLSDLRVLHLAALSPDDLTKAAQKTEEKTLKGKLNDYSLISSFYTDLLEKTYTDTETDLDRLARTLEAGEPVGADRVWVDSFCSFTEQQYAVLRAILRLADLTVTLTLPADSEKMISTAELLDTKKRLLKIAKEEGVPSEIKEIGGNKRQKNPLLLYASRWLWKVGTPTEPLPDGSETLHAYRAEDPFEAADFVAADICERVQAGARYGDFAIVAADASLYAGVLDTALLRAGIPCFLSVKANPAAYEPIKFITAAYAAVYSRKREDIAEMIKCEMSGISEDDADEWEIYTEKWSLSGQTLLDDRKWDMSPLGFVEEHRRTEQSEASLSRICATKEKIKELLLPLRDAVLGAVTVDDHCRAVTEFLLRCHTEEMLLARARELREAGEETAAADYAELWRAICAALDHLHETMGGDEVTSEGFKDLLKLVFDSTDLGHIPPSRDEVTIGSAPTIRLDGQKVLYLFGVCDGEFPASAVTADLFSESETEQLRTLGISVEPDAEIRAQKELFFFTRMLSAPSEDVIFVSFRFDCAGGAKWESFALSRLKTVCGDKLIRADVQTLPAGYLLRTPASSMSRLGSLEDPLTAKALRRWFSGREEWRETLRHATGSVVCRDIRLSEDVRNTVWGDTVSFSQSQIDAFVKCPFAYHQKYILRLDENEKAEFGSEEIGTFIHYLLERFLKEDRRPGNGEEISGFARHVSEGYLERLLPSEYVRDERMNHYVKRLVRVAEMILTELNAEAEESQFVPALFELPVGYGQAGTPDAIRVTLPNDKKAVFKGIIDRVDTYTVGDDIYVRVVDYKTGVTKFPGEKEWRKGQQIQLLLYLRALTDADPAVKTRLGGSEHSRIKPAGVMYFNCVPRDSEENEAITEENAESAYRKKMERSGLFLNDMEILRAMLPENGQIKYPFRYTKSGTIDGSTVRHLRTAEEWVAILNDLKNVITDVAQNITGGDAEPRPGKIKNKSACEYCPYVAQCRRPKI